MLYLRWFKSMWWKQLIWTVHITRYELLENFFYFIKECKGFFFNIRATSSHHIDPNSFGGSHHINVLTIQLLFSNVQSRDKVSCFFALLTIFDKINRLKMHKLCISHIPRWIFGSVWDLCLRGPRIEFRLGRNQTDGL